MRKSHIFLMIVAWFGLATYIVLNGASKEIGEDQTTGLNQKIQAQDERIEKLQAKMVEMERLLAARQQEPPPKPRNKANPTLQEHLNATQELHIAEDAAKPHVPHPTQEHLQTIRRLHEVQHKTDKIHSHPPVHIH